MSVHIVYNSDTAQKLCSILYIEKRLLVRLPKIQFKNPVTDFCSSFNIDTQYIRSFRFYGRKLTIGYKHGCKLKNRISRTKRIHVNEHQFIAAYQDVIHVKIRMNDCIPVRYCIHKVTKL